MKAFFEALLDALRHGRAAVLCCILSSSGSAPRGAGAKMAVFADGSILGTIGGGAAERQAIEKALRIFDGSSAGSCRFDLAAGQLGDVGMICGGEVTVSFRLLPAAPQELAELDAVCAALGRRENAWLLCRITGGAMGPLSVAHTGEVENDLLQRAPVYLPDAGWYAEPLTRTETVYIVGGGHVGAALARLLPQVGFSVVVYDEREELLARGAYPGAALCCGSFADFTRQVRVTENDYVVVMTPGHLDDRLVLAQVLETSACYIGCIGSRRKVELTNQALLAQGFDAGNIARIHAPIGLEIFAETPEEIAVSIAAELIRHRAVWLGTRKSLRAKENEGGAAHDTESR